MKEVKEEEEGLLEKEGFSFGPADKTDVELQTHWYFCARKSQKLSILECRKDYFLVDL